jgi:lipoate---protein ligase
MGQEIWRVLPWSREGAEHQLAAGDALLSGLTTEQRPAMRWYHASKTALIAGIGQPLSDFDQAACRERGVSLHRRASGGTAVLMTTDLLMLDVALPAGHPLYTPDVTRSYRWFGEVWAAALHQCGIAVHCLSVEVARDARQTLDPLTRRACFGGYSPYEVLENNRKLVGLSQIRRRSGALLQAGIYLHWRPEQLVSLLALAPDERATLTNRLYARATGLADRTIPPDCPSPPELFPTFAPVLPPPVTGLIATWSAALETMQGIELHETTWSEAEQDARWRAISRYTPLHGSE